MFQRVKEVAWFVDQFERSLLEIAKKAGVYTGRILPLLPETENGSIIAYDDEREDRRNTKNSRQNSSAIIESRTLRIFWWDRDGEAHVTFSISFTNEDGSRSLLMGEATGGGVINWWHPEDAEPFVALGNGVMSGAISEQFLRGYLAMLADAKEDVDAACEVAIQRVEAARERKQNED